MDNGLQGNCREFISSEDSVDIIVRYRDIGSVLESYPDICYQIINDNWAVLYPDIRMIPPLGIRDYDYYPIPKLYGLMEQSSMIASGIVSVKNRNTLNLTGRNVIIGFVDTGIDYLHEVFRDAAGRTRIYSIWDQTDDSGVPPDGFLMGSEYTQEQINEALQSENPYSVVPEVDEPGGHGTFIAGIAAGSDLGTDFTGAAPDSSIIMVKLRKAKKALRDFFLINEEAQAYSESDIMLGIRYLYEKATQAGKPLVICLGVGTSYGAHTSGSPLAQMLSEVSDMAATAVVLPTGNEGNSRHHYLGQNGVHQNYETVEIRVGENERGFMLELWGQYPDIYSVEFITPSGEIVERIPSRSRVNQEIDFVFSQAILTVDYRMIETVNGSQVITMRFENPDPGIWKIRVYNDNSLRGYFNMWLPISSFLSSDTFFLEPSPYVTLTMPSSAYYPITVSAYDHRSESIWIDSGRGFAANGIVKPDISAPGVSVYGPRSGGNHEEFTIRSGTSIAAAHVAGASALLFEWKRRGMDYYITNTSDIKSLLILGAQRDRNRTYPNPEWGYGKLDIAGTFEKLAGG